MKKQVVVIGAGLGGLSAAIHARLGGHEVLVLEQSSQVGGKATGIETQGYRLDPGPSIIILKRIYDDVFRRAGRNIDDYVQFKQLDPFSRVYFEGESSLDLPADRDDCLQVLEERFPTDAKSFKALLTKLDGVIGKVNNSIFKRPYDHIWQLIDWRLLSMAKFANPRSTYKQIVDRSFQHHLLRAFFYGFPSYGGQTYDSVAPGAFFIPFLMLSEGVYYPEGGVSAIPEAFHRLAQELGVQFRLSAKVDRIDVEEGRVTAVHVGNERIGCDAVISNVDRFTTGKWLGRTYNQSPSLSYFTMHWGVRRKVEGLSHHTLLVPKDFEQGFEDLYRKRNFPGSPIVYLNATHIEDPTTAPDGCSNIFAVVTSPAQEDHLDWREVEEIGKERIMRTMDKFGFGLSASELDFERVQTPAYFAEQHGNYKGSLYGPDEKHRLFGMMPNRNWDEEIKNLFYCGGSVQPGAGLPMVTLSGKFAAERLGRA